MKSLREGNVFELFDEEQHRLIIPSSSYVDTEGRLVAKSYYEHSAARFYPSFRRVYGRKIIDRCRFNLCDSDASPTHTRHLKRKKHFGSMGFYGYLEASSLRIFLLQTRIHYQKSGGLSLLINSLEAMRSTIDPLEPYFMVFPLSELIGLEHDELSDVISLIPDNVTLWRDY